MRSISDAALAFLESTQGVEPLNLVEVEWTPTLSVFYADRTITNYGIQGKILVLSNLEDVVNISGSSASVNISITLDDADGAIKNIYDQNDVHKRPVKVYQWFDGLNLNDAFLIFSGEINSPISWKEGDRTFSFEVVSKLEDREVGFAAELGRFDRIPDFLVGKGWPLPFGICLQIPIIQLDPIPEGVTLDGFGLVDPSLYEQLKKLSLEISELAGLAKLAFAMALKYYSFAHYDADGVYQLERVDDHFTSLGDQWTDKGNAYLLQMGKAQQDMAKISEQIALQKKYGPNAVRNRGGQCFPQGGGGQQITAQQLANLPSQTSASPDQQIYKIGGITVYGQMNADMLAVSAAIHPTQEGTPIQDLFPAHLAEAESSVQVGGTQNIVQNAGFFWVPPGVRMFQVGPLPVRYIIAMIPVSVINVWAMRSFVDTKMLWQVPGEYYSIGYQSFGPIVATILTLIRPLSHYEQGWEDQIYVDVQSPIGPNTVDIIVFLITTFAPGLGIDAASFDMVKAQIDPFPSNFCLFDRKNIVSLLSEIAFQSRCNIWLKNGVFFMSYLVPQPTPVDTITENDVIFNSLEITHSSTEQIVTKLIASYKTSYGPPPINRDLKIILRNNVEKYGAITLGGTHEFEQSYDWFIYNSPNLVDLAATFWLIRKSNMWKILKFRTPLHKLRLETFDAVTINFTKNFASLGSVVGIIQSTHLDSEKLQLEFEVWLPVRIGEMSQYLWAWPIESDVHTYASDTAFVDDPFLETNGQIGAANHACWPETRYTFIHKRRRLTEGNDNPGGTVDGTVVLQPQQGPLNNQPRPNFPNSTQRARTTSPPIVDEFTKPMTLPGYIVEGTHPKYKVAVYPKGIENTGKYTYAQVVDPNANQLDPNTWVMVVIIVWSEPAKSGKKTDPPEIKVAKYILPSTSQPGMFPGQVLSKTGIPSGATAGDGDFYTCSMYKKGLDGPVTGVTAKQLQIDPVDTIPAGTWCLIGQTVRKDPSDQNKTIPMYFIQVPIWLQ